MTNEEIAKDLTVAIANKMSNPTADSISETYHEILLSISASRQVVTLQTIEDHLTKQDYDSTQHMWNALMLFSCSIALIGVPLIMTAYSLAGTAANALCISGWSILIYGIVLFLIILVISKRWGKKVKYLPTVR